MTSNGNSKLVYSLKDLCKVCYTCVRECPAKAIRITNGQSEVITERCIGCGNCVMVCSQGAKVYYDSRQKVLDLLRSGEKTALLLAPSFPAEFKEISDYQVLVGMIRRMGFSLVIENAIGADVVARFYEEMINSDEQMPHISSDCPAIVNYIARYHPDLMKYVSSVVSPMVATARITRYEYGDHVKIVFAGPCIAKKAESTEVDEVLTFTELRDLFNLMHITGEGTPPSDFDPPQSGKGAIFPVSRGMLQTVNKSEDICEGNVVVASGRTNFRDALKEFEAGLISSNHLELLCCEGCIMGPGMTRGSKKYSRRKLISNYVKFKMDRLDTGLWESRLHTYLRLNMKRTHVYEGGVSQVPTRKQINEQLARMGKFAAKDHLNCGACGYETCEEHAIAILEGIAEEEMCLPYTIEQLHHTNAELNESNEKLANTQQALNQSEKLAHMGQLSAGIAHELNNPLGVITMYSNILRDEMPADHPARQDLNLIVEQANRCKYIVGSLLNFARKNQVKHVLTDLNKLVLKSMDSVVLPDTVKVEYVDHLKNREMILDPDQMTQVFVNLAKNAIDAMPHGGKLTIETSEAGSGYEIKFSDSGIGIPDENMDKLFTPFFTTKKIGQGTGLGLSLVYGIVKIHRGQIRVVSNARPEKGPTGTTFIINLPGIIEM